MPTTRRDGVQLFYADTGQGVPVLFHTGTGGDGSMWDAAGYTAAFDASRCLLMDHRGHGRSDCPTGVAAHRLEEYVADVLAVADDAGVDQFIMVGYSSGARTAFAVAARHPERCLAVAAIGSVPSVEPDGPPTDGPSDDRSLSAHIRDVGVATVVAEIASAEDEPAPQWFLDNLASTSTEMFATQVEASAVAPPAWDDLALIGAPTVLIAGSGECTDAQLDAAVARCRDAEGRRLAGYGHLQVFWHSEVTAPIITEFLRARGLTVSAR